MAHWVYIFFCQRTLGKSLNPILGRKFVIACLGVRYENGISPINTTWTGSRLSMWPESHLPIQQIATQ